MNSIKQTYEDGTIRYWQDNGMFLHNENGPAVIYPDGIKLWYLNGTSYYCFEKWCKDAGKTGEEATLLKLVWG